MRHFIAVCLGLLLCGGVGFAWYSTQPNFGDVERMIQENPYQAHPNADMINNVKFLETTLATRTALGDNPRLCLGSSELGLVEPCSSHPSHFFGEHNYGIDTLTVGRPFYQDLWHAIEVGALGDAIPDKKVAIFVGIQWFMSYQDVGENFRYAFSEDSYRAFLANPDVSSETKEAVKKQMAAYGIADEVVVGRKGLDAIAGGLDDAVFSFFTDAEKTKALLTPSDDDAQSMSTPLPPGRFLGAVEEPNWDEWLERETIEAKDASSSNADGFLDAYYHNSYEGWLYSTKANPPFVPGQEYQETEWTDFKLLLQVCKESGVEPLIVMMPTKGVAYDQTIYDYDTRQKWYTSMRALCDDSNVRYADFSSHEYDPYFLRDVMHLGWTGWVQVNKSLLEFFEEGTS